jgi:hypothetical protein
MSSQYAEWRCFVIHKLYTIYVMDLRYSGRKQMRSPRALSLGLLVMVGTLVLSACGSPAIVQPTPIPTPVMAMADMPDFVQNALPRTQEAYQFAVTNPHALETVPCYCGCSRMGHKSNLDCYIKDSANGKIVFDNHAAFCGVCVDITHDVVRLQTEGKTPLEIRTYVDAQYSSSGPSTDTVMPTS